MSKWKHPYVIKVVDGPRPYELHALCFGEHKHEPRHYRIVDSYPTLEKALKAKRKAYARLEK
jgi:hypothetical protein